MRGYYPSINRSALAASIFLLLDKIRHDFFNKKLPLNTFTCQGFFVINLPKFAVPGYKKILGGKPRKIGYAQENTLHRKMKHIVRFSGRPVGMGDI